MKKQLDLVRKAYDLTVEEYNRGIDPLAKVPDEFKNSLEFKEFQECINLSCSSAAPENKSFLNPQVGMQFLDAGCCANLASYRLDRWLSIYYGIDISSKLMNAMKTFVSQKNLPIGGLWVAEISKLPFESNFFDIAALIGVLEYCSIEYTKKALSELNRISKPNSKIVLDIPNMSHPHVNTMFELEKYLGRPNIPKSKLKFEKILKPLFHIDKIDDSKVMLKYFVRVIK